MKEDFLHYLWRLRRFDHTDLQTTDGQPLLIVEPGEHNQHAGPDFLNARLRIGDTLWAGNVEMHLRASEWQHHGHHTDAAYDNVILHVVLEEDQHVVRANGQRIPCLEIKSRIPPKLSGVYQQLLHHENWVPCQRQLHTVDQSIINMWMERLMVERLEAKSKVITERLVGNKNDWEGSFYESLARNLGAKVNAQPFDMLARSLPLRLLSRHRNSQYQVEALLFGQAGLLGREFEEDYPQQLQREFLFLRKKYRLQPLTAEIWKFLRLRPANFPTLRIAQLAALICSNDHLFSKLLAAQNIREIENCLAVKISAYWKDHYVFDKTSGRQDKPLGRDTIHLLVVNTIAPFLFMYGKHRDEDGYRTRALQLLESLPAEKNAVIDQWRVLGVSAYHADQSQALLQLKTGYCDHQQCLQCAIGNAILSK